MIKTTLYGIAIICVLFFSASLGVLFYVSQQPWVDFSVLEHYNPGKPSILLDDEGNEWARFRLDKRDVISFKQIPKNVINAFIAAEDWNFFKHSGLSVKGIIRSTVVNLYSFRKAQGASTITQQLVRLLFFETEKSFKRKIKEQILSIVVEQQFTKEQILETYLNHVYLGSGIYGVEAASMRFWGKHIKDVTNDEAAILAAIVRCPQHYCPLYNPESSRKRRNLILKNMYTLGFITKQDYDQGIAQPVNVLKYDSQLLAPHFKEALRQMLEETVGKQALYTGGLKIQTTLNRKMQEAAEKAFREQFKKLHKKFSPDLEGALLCIEGLTGAIKAMVGGCNFGTSQYNRALQARRQMGSTFKPLVFASALAAGRSLTDIEVDEPITLTIYNQEWTPRNANNLFEGSMTLAHALATSNNMVSIKTFLAHQDRIMQLAQESGLTGATYPYPSLALGSLEASLDESVAMMNIFAQQGTYAQPHMLLWVKDEWGTKLWKGNQSIKPVLNSITSNQIAKSLSSRIEQAKRNQPDKWFDCEAFGKTGTTNDARSCWFIGATPKYTTGVYIGHDDNRSLGQEAGEDVFASQTAMPIWRDFNALIEQEVKQFTFDASLRDVTINAITGLPCEKNDPQALSILVQ